MFLNNPLHDVKPESGSLADLLRREEWIEDPPPDLCRNTGTIVGNANNDMLPFGLAVIATLPEGATASSALSMRFAQIWFSPKRSFGRRHFHGTILRRSSVCRMGNPEAIHLAT